MKPVLTPATILTLVAAAASAPAEEATSQPAPAADTPRTGAASTLEKLGAQLRSSDPEIRAAAAAGLLWVEEEAAADLLVRTLADDPAARVRQAAARALGLRDAPSALPPLTRAVRHDASPAVRTAADLAIRQIRFSSGEAAHDLSHLPTPGRTTRIAGTTILVGGTVIGSGLLVLGVVAGIANSGPLLSESEPQPRREGSSAPLALALSGLATIGVSIATGLLLRRVGAEQMRKALAARKYAASSSSGGRLGLAWTF